MRILFLIASVFALSHAGSTAQAQEGCDSPRVISSLIQHVYAFGSSNPEWMVKMHLDIPYFRMKDVQISTVSVQTKGPTRTGLDCEANLRMVPPAEFRASAPVIVGRFGYVIMPASNGGFELDLY